MLLCNLFILTLTFNELIGDLDALVCPKGEKVVERGGTTFCEPCQPGYFQPTENQSQRCQGCTVCSKELGSFEKVPCTKETNAVCQCLEGFTPFVEDEAWCKCGPGSEVRQGVCSKCREGYFSPDEKPCQKRKECKATGVKQHGDATSDNVCNEEPQSNTLTATSSSSVIKRLLTVMTTSRPHEGGRTQGTRSTTTSSPQGDRVRPTSNTSNHTVVVIVCLGIAGLLVWTVITCKMHITPCWQRKKMQNKDSCRRPVEESGDSSETSFKLNPEP